VPALALDHWPWKVEWQFFALQEVLNLHRLSVVSRYRAFARLLTPRVPVTCYDRAQESIPWADAARRSMMDRERDDG
jgi:hypothetical protein